jgi:hypothetical protein
MSFGDTRLLLTLWLLPLAACVLIIANRRHGARLLRYNASRLRELVVGRVPGRMSAYTGVGLRLIALACILIALAKPRWGSLCQATSPIALERWRTTKCSKS